MPFRRGDGRWWLEPIRGTGIKQGLATLTVALVHSRCGHGGRRGRDEVGMSPSLQQERSRLGWGLRHGVARMPHPWVLVMLGVVGLWCKLAGPEMG